MFLQQLLLHSEQYPNLLILGNCNSKSHVPFLLNKIVKRVISSATSNASLEEDLMLNDNHSDDENEQPQKNNSKSNKLSEDDILKNQKQDLRLLIIDAGDYKQAIPKRLQQDMNRYHATFKKSTDESDKLVIRVDSTDFEKANDLYKYINSILTSQWSSSDSSKKKKVIVVINSLSALAFWFGDSPAFQLVQKLLQLSNSQDSRVCSVVSVVHTDTHPKNVVEQYKLHAQGIISIIASEDMDQDETFYFPVEGSNQDEEELEEKILNIAAIDFKCDIHSLRLGGKLLFNEEYYKISATSDDEGAMTHVKHPFIAKRQKKVKSEKHHDEEEEKPQQQNVTTTQQSGVKRHVGEKRHITIGEEHVHGPNCSHNNTSGSSMSGGVRKSGLSLLDTFDEREKEKARQNRMDRPMTKEDIENQVTFKIGLTEKEKRARETLELPFMKEGLTNHSNLTPQEQRKQNQGFIIIDSDDEYEEDDPDDDLEL
ncbi:predicted protein [Naegleria gruberi]|uniref:Elongator complex protein 5 n=1 Tax=Naegleria gruberi TaxID=5762 RepID=D2V2I2_NAEGR|nr:uncharacterized protein NAEGRDRAFT_63009 [Naegleria gruberi]EFC49063.1 predicted protein [Naegleria gruberi]|eukprot:XP_002681807.1 predicted protein [Naegleria gruberi strain NEG-M]